MVTMTTVMMRFVTGQVRAQAREVDGGPEYTHMTTTMTRKR